MLGLIVTPGQPGSARIGETPPPRRDHGILLRTRDVGVCGTDKEISAGMFGVAPEGQADLVLGHEFLGEVVEDGFGFAAGDLVTATVRRSCGHCAACAQRSPDACDTGDYLERGITRIDGFARELVVEDPGELIPVPASLGRLGVLAEPSSICSRALRHARAIGARQVWHPQRALVIGAGAIGMLATYILRLDGHEVWTAERGSAHDLKGRLVEASGARFVSVEATRLEDVRDDVGGFDLVVECVGDAQLMLNVLGLLRRNGVGCLLGLDGRQQTLTAAGSVVGIDAVLENRVLFGSVNAHADDWLAAVDRLVEIHGRWGDALEAMVGLRVTPDRFGDAFAYDGVKAALRFS